MVHYVYKAHASTDSVCSMSTSPPRPRPELSKDVRDTMVDRHKAGIIYRTTSKMFGEKVKTVGVIFQE